MPAHDVYPSNVLVFDGPPPSVGFFTPYHVAAISNVVEVMVIGAGTNTTHGKASAGASEPAAVTADNLQDALVGLKTPIAAFANPNDARASLEEARKHILEEGIAVASAKRRMKATQREYNSAYGLTPISEDPSRLALVRGHGRFISEILGGNQPVYETPAANLRAAQAAMEEMRSLGGEERAFQEKRVKDLLDAANENQTRLDPGQAQSESPGARRNPSGHHHTEGSSSHRTFGQRSEGSQDRRSQRQSEHTLSRRRGRDESDTACEVPLPGRTHASGLRGASPLIARIGPRVLEGDQDARRSLITLAQSALLEEDGPIGPTCFGPRIRGEPFPRGFTLSRDSPKYNGTAKPQDWLIDYTIAIGIARGNKRVAVCYVLLMLAGSARTWLNSLPADSVNSWVDFEEAFVRNFTGTYKRPGRPRELAMCVQRPANPFATTSLGGRSSATPATGCMSLYFNPNTKPLKWQFQWWSGSTANHCRTPSDNKMAAVPETLLETSFPLHLVDSLKKCHVRRMPIFLYHEHWVNADTEEYHVDVIVKANDYSTSWFF
ncbi:Endoglucanase 3 [Hordeum vulgare]|nr:Endoglucanase 3 [Hordeum vulgare]